MDPIKYESQEVFSHNKFNANIIHVVNTILDAEAESGIDKNWCLLNNQSTCNAFINGKYLSNVIDDPAGKYLCVHFNSVVTYTKKIGDLPGYSNHIWYNPKGVSNMLSLGLVQKHHLVIHDSKDRKEFVVHSPQQPTFNMAKYILFYHNIRQLLKNKNNAHIMVNDSRSPIPQVG